MRTAMGSQGTTSDAAPSATDATGRGLADAHIASAFREACLLELEALKPGNVHRFADGHGMVLAQFEASACCAAPEIARCGARVGARVLAAVRASWAAVACNTNLGILLLCAPLAAGAELARKRSPLGPALALSPSDLQRATSQVLDTLDTVDAEQAFEAIAMANPGGLGRVDAHDVRDQPDVDLRTAMVRAAHRDRIARQYASCFEDVFGTALPILRERLALGDAPDLASGVLYLELLARWPDSHVLRKFGDSTAQTVSSQARSLRDHFPEGAASEAARAGLMEWDARLKTQGINPGSTADLTVATLFAYLLTGGNVT